MKERMSRLPIFPLPNAVLIPGGLLPLHVFEPRYRKLVEDCLLADGIFAVALLSDEPEAATIGDPGVCPLVGVGRIQSHEQLDDGRYLLLHHGWMRAQILEELPSTQPYRLVRARPISDETGAPSPLVVQTAQVIRQMVVQLAERHENDSAKALTEACLKEQDPGRLADLIGAAMLQQPAERQRFLEQLTVPLRLDHALEVVGQALARASSTANEGVMN